MNNWSKVGIGFGLLFSIFTSWRYFIQYDHTSLAIICILIGSLIMAVSWLYDKQLQHLNKKEKQDIIIENNKADISHLIFELKNEGVLK